MPQEKDSYLQLRGAVPTKGQRKQNSAVMKRYQHLRKWRQGDQELEVTVNYRTSYITIKKKKTREERKVNKENGGKC